MERLVYGYQQGFTSTTFQTVEKIQKHFYKCNIE